MTGAAPSETEPGEKRPRGLRRLVAAVGWRWREWRDASVDRRFGTDTAGIIDDMDELGVDGQRRAHARGYEGIQVPLFGRMIRALDVVPAEWTFVDLGAGKGRALILAAEAGFGRVVGVELSPRLHEIAESNRARYRRRRPGKAQIELRLQDAAELVLPEGDVVCFLYNPFDEVVLGEVAARLETALASGPRRLRVLYRNPVWTGPFDASDSFQLLMAERSFRIYGERQRA